MCYTQKSLEERYYIEFELKKGIKRNEIAKSLNRDKSTIGREVSRNTGLRGYRHKQANDLAIARHKQKNKNIKMIEKLIHVINEYIKSDWSPEQISGFLKKDNQITVHHETIYQYILTDKKAGGMLYLHLRHQNKTYRKRYGNTRNRTGIPKESILTNVLLLPMIEEELGIGKVIQSSVKLIKEPLLLLMKEYQN